MCILIYILYTSDFLNISYIKHTLEDLI